MIDNYFINFPGHNGYGDNNDQFDQTQCIYNDIITNIFNNY